jgi:hypothetical protein
MQRRAHPRDRFGGLITALGSPHANVTCQMPDVQRQMHYSVTAGLSAVAGLSCSARMMPV